MALGVAHRRGQTESGHTPSREHSEYWDGGIPWIGIKDARIHHGGTIAETLQTVTQEGLDNSAARLLPAGTVCLSRTASVGYVVITERPMATSQDFVNWVCSQAIDPKFLLQLFIAENESLFRFGKGSTHTTIYYPEVKAFQVCLPPVAEQRRIVAELEGLQARGRRAREALDAVPPLLERLRQSILAAAFRGDLTKDWRASKTDLEPARVLIERTPEPGGKSSGRAASMSMRRGIGGIAVGHPGTRAPDGWEWVALSRIARMGSGHTPSREHSDYWDGGIPWIGIRDARENHGREITTTFQTVSDLGLENSASRLLPARTVCFSRTASVGYVTIMGESMATSQDFANWTCSPALLPEYLMFALLAEGEHIKTFGEGSTHTTIYYPELKAFHLCLAPLEEQREIVARVSRMLDVVARLIAEAENQSQRQESLARSILAKAFRGELVPQDPNDQPAEAALLKSGIAAESTAPMKPHLKSNGKRREPARSTGGRADARPGR